MAATLRATFVLGALAVLAGAAITIAPTVGAWRAERAAEHAFAEELERIELDIIDKRVSTRGGFSDDDASRWRFARVHAALRAHAAAPEPGFRGRVTLTLGVYDRAAALIAEAERVATMALQLQSLHPDVFDDPAETRRVLDGIAAARGFIGGYRARVESDHEWARAQIARSELTPEQRAAVWAIAEKAYLAVGSNVAGAERLAPKLAALASCIEYLDANRGRYFTYPSGAVVFKDPVRQKHWSGLVDALKG